MIDRLFEISTEMRAQGFADEANLLDSLNRYFLTRGIPRYSPSIPTFPVFEHPLFSFDFGGATLRAGRRLIQLPPQRNKIMRVLTQNVNNTVPTDYIQRVVWGDLEEPPVSNSYDVLISRLRKDVEGGRREVDGKKVIVTIPRVGLKLVDESKLSNNFLQRIHQSA